MHLAKLRTVGGSVMFAIPKAIMEGLGLTANTQVGLSVSDGRLIIEPHPRQRYTLSDLLDQCDHSAPMTEADQAWLEAAQANNVQVSAAVLVNSLIPAEIVARGSALLCFILPAVTNENAPTVPPGPFSY